MSLANLIVSLSAVNADPTTTPDTDDTEVVTTIVARSENAKPSKSKPARNEAAPIRQQTEPVRGMMLPDRGTLDAKSFLMAMRDAGKRCTAEGKPFIDQREVRNDQIRAIHAFYYEVRHGVKVHVGYDPTGSFGSQDQASRALAQRELRGAPKVTAEVAKPSRSVAGYVAGMPEPSQRILSNLRAREQAACEAMLDAKTEEERKAHASVLAQCKAAIDELVG